MDDVVADFKGYAQHILGYPFNEKILDEIEWNKVKSNQRLFRDLNPTIDAQQMMSDIGKYLELNKHISIFFLTAILIPVFFSASRVTLTYDKLLASSNAGLTHVPLPTAL
jgi:uncharacterized membrane protein